LVNVTKMTSVLTWDINGGENSNT